MQVETAYLRAQTQQSGSKALPAVLYLLSINVGWHCLRHHVAVTIQEVLHTDTTGLQVCPRCCLRFNGVRDNVYGHQSPIPAKLAACVQAALDQSILTDAQQAGAHSVFIKNLCDA